MEFKASVVRIEMQDGKVMRAELFPFDAPITCKNFIKLVNEGYYDGLTFHRIISGFMIQGGCPKGDGTGGPNYMIKGEFTANGVENHIKHTRGTLSMARAAAPNSAGSQFFIMHADGFALNGHYAAFGRLIEGYEVLDELANVKTDYSDKPLVPVIMKKVTIE